MNQQITMGTEDIGFIRAKLEELTRAREQDRAGIERLTTKVEDLHVKLAELTVTFQKPGQTPLCDSHKAAVDALAKKVEKLQAWQLKAAGVIVALLTIFQLFLPQIRKLFTP